MPFSTACSTPLANFEAGLNYKDVSDPAVMARQRLGFWGVLGFRGRALKVWTLGAGRLGALAWCVSAAGRSGCRPDLVPPQGLGRTGSSPPPENKTWPPPPQVSFPLVGDPDGASLVAWTTTPWTLPSNLALCVHPAFTYVKVGPGSFRAASPPLFAG